jgi:hypothetical protein
MEDKSMQMDNEPVMGGTEVDQRKECYRCGSLYPTDMMNLFGYLCPNCYGYLQEFGRIISQSDSVKNGGTQVHSFIDGDEITWAIFNPNNGDYIRDIARNFQLNLLPASVWTIQMQQRTGYLLVVGNITDECVPFIMEKICPKVPITHFEQIVTRQSTYKIAAGRALTAFITGKPCENMLKMTFDEVTEMMIYASDLEKAGLQGIEIYEKMLTRFYVSNPMTRKAALIGDICGSTRNKAKDEGLIPSE